MLCNEKLFGERCWCWSTAMYTSWTRIEYARSIGIKCCMHIRISNHDYSENHDYKASINIYMVQDTVLTNCTYHKNFKRVKELGSSWMKELYTGSYVKTSQLIFITLTLTLLARWFLAAVSFYFQRSWHKACHVSYMMFDDGFSWYRCMWILKANKITYCQVIA